MSGQRWARRDFLRWSSTLVMVGAGLSACSRVHLEDEPNGGTLLDRLRDAGEVRIGFANEAPYSYIDSNAEITGEAAELAKVIFRRLGVPEVTPIPSEFGSLIPGLKVGLFDVIGAGMFVTPVRCAEVLFTNPDYEAKTSFLVPKGNPKGLRTYADVIAQQDVRLGTMIGAAEQIDAIDSGVDESRMTSYPDALSGLEAVEADRVDAFALTRISLNDVLGKNPGAPLELTEAFVPEIDGVPRRTGGAFAFLKDQQNIVDAFNAELSELKESGELLEIVRPFGFSEAEMTDLTATELCQAPAAG
jgi:polar amino acid transport system substrate-binding protein